MVVVNGRIDWVGPVADLKTPAGAATTDWSGKFVMPGIINLHGHLGNTIDLVQDPKNFTRENVERQLKIYARYGVTTMLTMGSEQPLILQMRTEQRRTGFTPAGIESQSFHERRIVKRKVRDARAFVSTEREHIVVKPRDTHTPLGIVQLCDHVA